LNQTLLKDKGRMLYKTWKSLKDDRTKAKAGRTEQGIIIINQGIELPQTTFPDTSGQTNLCCTERKHSMW
jgi:hypothetical protein